MTFGEWHGRKYGRESCTRTAKEQLLMIEIWDASRAEALERIEKLEKAGDAMAEANARGFSAPAWICGCDQSQCDGHRTLDEWRAIRALAASPKPRGGA